MAADDTKRAVEDEARLLVETVDKARGTLSQLNLPYPGGDVCPQRVIVGLSGLLAALCTCEVTLDGEWTEDERLALEWLRTWVDAGKAMLPKGHTICTACGGPLDGSTKMVRHSRDTSELVPVCQGCFDTGGMLWREKP